MPRVILKLEALHDFAYPLKYHHKVQGFVYSLLKGTEYEHLHDKKGYKFFCFSCVYPPKDTKKGELKELAISSPDNELIRCFVESLLELERVKIGDMFFSIEEIRLASPRIRRRVSLLTRTPIVIRIPKRRYRDYGITGRHDFVYWRPNIAFEAFHRQLEENLIKKFKSFAGTDVEEDEYTPLFQQFVFKKSVCNHIVLRNREIRVFGSLWEFHFSHLSDKKRELLQFSLDAGFGERNSMGFGFMEVKRG